MFTATPLGGPGSWSNTTPDYMHIWAFNNEVLDKHVIPGGFLSGSDDSSWSCRYTFRSLNDDSQVQKSDSRFGTLAYRNN